MKGLHDFREPFFVWGLFWVIVGISVVVCIVFVFLRILLSIFCDIIGIPEGIIFDFLETTDSMFWVKVGTSKLCIFFFKEGVEVSISKGTFEVCIDFFIVGVEVIIFIFIYFIIIFKRIINFII